MEHYISQQRGFKNAYEEILPSLPYDMYGECGTIRCHSCEWILDFTLSLVTAMHCLSNKIKKASDPEIKVFEDKK